MRAQRAQIARAAVLLAFAAFGCGRTDVAGGPDTGARLAARTFYTALVRSDWPAAFATLDADTKERLGMDGFVAQGTRYLSKLGFEPQSVEIRSCDEGPESATAHIVLAGQNGSRKVRLRTAVTLRKSGSGWSVVLPEDIGG